MHMTDSVFGIRYWQIRTWPECSISIVSYTMLEKETSGMGVLQADMESVEYQNLNIYRYIHLNDACIWLTCSMIFLKGV